MNRRTLILGAVAVSVAAFGGAAWVATQPEPVVRTPTVSPDVAQALVRSHSPVLGAADAPVTIVEFFDPACEACRAFHPIVKDILAQHRGMVRLVVRYTPFHGAASEEAIRILEAARMQGVFEPVLEAILGQQRQWASHNAPSPERLMGIAAAAGLDPQAARAQMLAPQTNSVLDQDRADVETVGVRQTPTFFVNQEPLKPFGELELRTLVAIAVSEARS
jgi:protein-disulfide isomerase